MASQTLPLSHTIDVERFSDIRIRIPIYLASTNRRPDDVTGWTGRLTVTRSLQPVDTDTPVLQKVGVVDAEAKDFTVDLTDDDLSFDAGAYYWTVRLVAADGKVYPLIGAGARLNLLPNGAPKV